MTGARQRTGLALFGGAFNPPHRTHRRLVEAALQQLPVQQLRVLPAGDHPHKHEAGMAPAAARLRMCQLAFAGLPDVVVDDRELRRQGRSYTVLTLQELHDEAPARPLFFLLGADNVPLLPSWHEHHRILQLATVVTFPRRGCRLDAAQLAGLDLTDAERQRLLAHVLPFDADDVAASTVRAALARGAVAVPDLDPEVLRYIVAQHLYGA